MSSTADKVTCRTAVVVERVRPTLYRAYPLAEPSRVALGTRDEALLELEVYLERAFESASAQELMPHLHRDSMEVVTLRLDVHRDAQRVGHGRVPLQLHAIRIPEDDRDPTRGAWGMLPCVSRTFFVHDGEDFADVAIEAAHKAITADGVDDSDLLEWSQVLEFDLEPIDIRTPQHLLASAPRRLSEAREAQQRRQALRRLRDVGAERSYTVEPAPVVSSRRRLRDDVVDLLQTTPHARHVLLVGERGSGRSHLIDAACARVGRTTVRTSVMRILAGAGGFGALSERLEKLFAATQHTKAVLWFDDLPDLFAQQGKDVTTFAVALRNAMLRDDVVVVADATTDEEHKMREQNPSLFALFSRLALPQMTVADVLDVLQSRPTLQMSDAPWADGLVRQLRDLPLLGAMPKTAVELWEHAQSAHAQDRKAGPLQRRHLLSLVSDKTGVPLFLLDDGVTVAPRAMQDQLQASVVGQGEAIRRVADAVCRLKARLHAAERPLCNLLFVGPTGVGKTEVAKALAHALFGSRDKMVRFDMSEFADDGSAERLIRGTRSDDGLLTKQVRRTPFCVLLLDEIEKAHPAVFDLLLQVLGEGRLSDAKGRVVSFAHCLLIMTSNLGATRGPSIGFSSADDAQTQRYLDAARERFRPEFFGRLDAVVPFSPLSDDDAKRVTRLLVGQVAQRPGLLERHITLDVADDVVAALAAMAQSHKDGARSLRRLLETKCVSPLSGVLTRLPTRQLERVLLHFDDDAAAAVATQARKALGTLGAQTLWASLFDATSLAPKARRSSSESFSYLRRDMDELLEVPQLEDVRQRMTHLAADLASWSDDVAASRRAELARQYEQLRDLWAPVDALRGRLYDAEEVAHLAADAGEDPQDLLPPVDDFRSLQVRRLLVPLLAPHLSAKRQVWLTVQDVLGERASAAWWTSLHRWAQAHDVDVRVHPWKGRKASATASWPTASVFDAGLPLAQALDDHVALDKAIVRADGALAALLLPFEAGLHQVKTTTLQTQDKKTVSPLFVIEVATFAEHLTPLQWEDAEQLLYAGPALEQLKQTPPTRSYTLKGTLVTALHQSFRTPPDACLDVAEEIAFALLLRDDVDVPGARGRVEALNLGVRDAS